MLTLMIVLMTTMIVVFVVVRHRAIRAPWTSKGLRYIVIPMVMLMSFMQARSIRRQLPMIR